MVNTANFTKELKELLTYTKTILGPQYNIGTLSVIHLAYSIMKVPTCVAHKALDKTTMSSEIESLENEYKDILEKQSVVDSEPDWSTKIQNILTDLAEKEKIVSSGHVLCSLIEHDEFIQQQFKRLRVSRQRLLTCTLSILKEWPETLPEPDEVHETASAGQETNLPVKVKNPHSITTGYITTTTPPTPTNECEILMDNLNNVSREGKIPTVVCCDKINTQICKTLARKDKNNVALVGRHGVGKTAIVRNLANIILGQEAPTILENKIVLQFDLMKIIVGAALRGSLETRLRSLYVELIRENKYIVFIDDIDKLLRLMGQESIEIIQFFNLLIESPNVGVIITCDEKGFIKYFTDGSKLRNNFQRIDVEEPNDEDAIEMLMSGRERYEQFHDVRFDVEDGVLDLCVKLARMYCAERALPDSAFDLLDEIGASYSYRVKQSSAITTLKEELVRIAAEKNKLVGQSSSEAWEKMDELGKSELAVKSQISIIEKEERLHHYPYDVWCEDVYRLVSDKIGKKIDKVNTDDKIKLRTLHEDIKSVVIGQDQAVDEVCRVVKRQRLNLFKKDRPAVLFFGGSTGTGKTYLAKQLAERVFGDKKLLVRFDMSEYADKTSVNKLYGSSSGYVGYDEGGQLTEAIKNKPRCVLLLDEIEKANEEVFNVFLQVFDEGRLTDNKGVTVSFKDVIIIMTSNIGASDIAARGNGIGFTSHNNNSITQDIVEKALKRKFRPEFLNRIDSIIYFNNLSDDMLRQIAYLELQKSAKSIESNEYFFHPSLLGDKAVDAIIKASAKDKSFGGRSIVRSVERLVNDRIVEFIINNDVQAGHEFTYEEILAPIYVKADDSNDDKK